MPEYREQFDYSCARAVANLSTLSELCIPFVKVGGSFISMKGPSEDVSRGTISDFVDNIDMLKGEFVLVVEGNKNIINYSELDIIEHVNLYISDGLSEMDSIKKVARDRNVPKSEIYKYYHKNK